MTSQRILIAGLILLGVLNICTLGFILFKSQQHGKHFYGNGHNDQNENHPGKFLSKRLHFTPEQEASLEKMRKPHEEKVAFYKAKKDSLRKQSFELIKADTYDTVRADAISKELAVYQRDLEKEMTTHFLAIKALCTKDQQEDFNKFIDHVVSEKRAQRERENHHGHRMSHHHKKHHHHHRDRNNCQRS